MERVIVVGPGAAGKSNLVARPGGITRLPVIEKGYGFISRTDGPDVFVHYSEIDGYGFRSLEENQYVEFEVAQGPKGLRPPASAPSEPRAGQACQEIAARRGPGTCWCRARVMSAVTASGGHAQG